jgi:prepilin-type N-terminal cleavage/methylation domain-containing protein
MDDNVKTNSGFSLLELLIVVAIILIIATIAIPSLLKSRQAANESAAVANLRTLNTAQVAYSSTHSGAYGALTDLETAGLTDTSFSNPLGKSGYVYTITLSLTNLDYTAAATAQAASTGRYDYYTTPDYVIRYSSFTTRAPSSLAGEPVR